MWMTDKKLAERAPISPINLYMDDEKKYRDIEHEVLKEFSELEYDGYPMGCLVGESALDRQDNIDIIKDGLVIWLDVDPEYSWSKTQYVEPQGSGLYIPQ